VWGPKEPPHHVEKRADKTASIKSRATFSSMNNQKNTKKNLIAQATVVKYGECIESACGAANLSKLFLSK